VLVIETRGIFPLFQCLSLQLHPFICQFLQPFSCDGVVITGIVIFAGRTASAVDFDFFFLLSVSLLFSLMANTLLFYASDFYYLRPERICIPKQSLFFDTFSVLFSPWFHPAFSATAVSLFLCQAAIASPLH
jgi:hypothetical protein